MICHLIVSGLAPLKNIGPNILENVDLPALETLLARGTPKRIENASIESWLAEAFGLHGAGESPLAPYALRGEGMDPGQDGWLCADPVHLHIASEKVVLADSSQFSIAAEDARQMVETLNAHFIDQGFAFFAPAPGRWYLRTSNPPQIRTTPTSEVVGRAITSYLPEGDERAYWRGILNEAQMVLHGHPCNERREQSGEVPINSLWFWGAGKVAALNPRLRYDRIWSDNPLARGLGLFSDVRTEALPVSTDSLLDVGVPDDTRHLVVLPPLPPVKTGTAVALREALVRLEQCWFAPLLVGIRQGLVATLAVHAVGAGTGSTLEFNRRDRHRWWRRRKRFFDYAS